MKTIRIIPRLDIKGPNVVKGIHLEGLRVLGSPSDFAKFYYEQGADEILFMDVVASLYERNSLHDIIEKTSDDIFIPITVGGGLRSVEDIKSVLRSGADKVCLNTAVIKNPELIRSASEKFGSSTIVVAIEAIRQESGTYMAFTDNGRQYTGVNAVEWAQKIEELGAGELILTSVDHEGAGLGFDKDFINLIAHKVSIPVIVHGGAGKKEDVLEIIKNSPVDAICAAAIFHYDFIKNNTADFNQSEGNFDFLKSGKRVKNIETINILDLKSYLAENGVSLRN